MTWQTILTSVAMPIILALLTSICVAAINVRAMQKSEKEKREYERMDFVVTKLYSILERVQALHGFTTTSSDAIKTLNDTLEKRSAYIELFRIARPLMAKCYCHELDEISAKEKLLHPQLLPFYQVSAEYLLNEGKEVLKEWNEIIVQLPATLSEAIQKQISVYFNGGSQ